MACRPSNRQHDAKVIAELVETTVGPAARSFILERLSQGNQLAHEMLASLPLTQGRITTFLPPGVVPQSVEDFATGGKLPTLPTSQWKGLKSRDETLLMIPVPTTNSWLVTKIKEYLLEAKDRICVLEDALKRPGDPVLGRLSTRYAIHDREIYHLLFQEDAEEQRILETLRAARSIPTFIGALSAWKGDPLKVRLGALSISQIKILANSTQKLVVGAYDGEGYLIWDVHWQEKKV